jgi:vacuolar protein sorting-associated protein IST1
MLMHKFGREFALAVMENRDECVPARVRDGHHRKTKRMVLILGKKVSSKLVVAAPPSELVDSALQVIAEGYGISWKPPGSNDGDEGGLKVCTAMRGDNWC